ncbi:unnamed protein product [Closterium sp. NIES-64]|nr:unnamed protein product [Closterium sp. NIES-64]
MRINRQTAVSRCRLSTLTVRAASDGQAAAETAEPQSASFDASLVSKNSVVVPDSELSITKTPFGTTSFGTIGLTVGLLLLSYGFGAYFQFLPGSESSALMLTYGFPTALIGFALKYAELKPVPCTSYADAVALREAQATPILQQVRGKRAECGVGVGASNVGWVRGSSCSIEPKPVPCTSYADAVALRETQAAPILQQARDACGECGPLSSRC